MAGEKSRSALLSFVPDDGWSWRALFQACNGKWRRSGRFTQICDLHCRFGCHFPHLHWPFFAQILSPHQSQHTKMTSLEENEISLYSLALSFKKRTKIPFKETWRCHSPSPIVVFGFTHPPTIPFSLPSVKSFGPSLYALSADGRLARVNFVWFFGQIWMARFGLDIEQTVFGWSQLYNHSMRSYRT